MNQMTADTSIYASESEWGDWQCWEWAVHANSRVYMWGQRYTVRRYVYSVCRGPLVPGERLVNTCGNSGCVSPHHHVPASAARTKPAENVGDARRQEPTAPTGRQGKDAPASAARNLRRKRFDEAYEPPGAWECRSVDGRAGNLAADS